MVDTTLAPLHALLLLYVQLGEPPFTLNFLGQLTAVQSPLRTAPCGVRPLPARSQGVHCHYHAENRGYWRWRSRSGEEEEGEEEAEVAEEAEAVVPMLVLAAIWAVAEALVGVKAVIFIITAM